jgi:hypothetical protein
VSTTASRPSSMRLVTSEHLPWRKIFAGRSGSFGNSIQARVPAASEQASIGASPQQMPEQSYAGSIHLALTED